MSELTRALYYTYYLGEMGYECKDREFYQRAEAGLEEASKRGVADSVWQLSHEAALLVEEVLRVHDIQLGSAKSGHVFEADRLLRRFLASKEKASPFD